MLAVEAAGLTDGELWRSLLAIVVVFGVLGALAWAARRGRLGFFTRQPAHVRVEATVPLGERRSLMVVAIEGRRLLLGLTPMQVSLVTELTQPSPEAASGGFDAALARAEATASPDGIAIMIRRIAVIAGGLLLAAAPAWAQQAASAPQQVDLAIQGVGNVSAPLQVVLLLTLLSFVPAILMTMTSFTRIVIVFHFLRQALGTQEQPSNQILLGLALFLTVFVMAPVGDQVNTLALQPAMAGRITVAQALERGAPPVRTFMLKQTRERDLALFVELAQAAAAEDARRAADARGRAGLRDLGAEDRLPDGVLPVPAVPAHRSRGLDHAALDGHAAAPAGDDLAAVQDHALRDDRRLEPAGRLPRAQFRGVRSPTMSEALVVGIVRQAIELAILVSLPMLAAGLIAGVLVSVFQTVTSIQDNVLAFIPRAAAIFVTFALTFPWMLRLLAGFAERLVLRLPEMVR